MLTDERPDLFERLTVLGEHLDAERDGADPARTVSSVRHPVRRSLVPVVAAAAVTVIGLAALTQLNRGDGSARQPIATAPAVSTGPHATTPESSPTTDVTTTTAETTTVVAVPPDDVSLEALVEMAPPLLDIAGLSGKEVDVGQGVSIVVKSTVDEFNSQSDICLVVSENGDETGRLCADQESLGGLIFMVIPEQSSGRQVALALVDSSLQIRSMADQRPEYVDLGGASAYFVDISSLPVSEGNVRIFRMVVSGPGINAQVLSRIPAMPVG